MVEDILDQFGRRLLDETDIDISLKCDSANVVEYGNNSGIEDLSGLKKLGTIFTFLLLI